MDLLDRRDVSMVWGSERNPVGNDSNSARAEDMTNGSTIPIRENISDISKGAQLVLQGNRCGHVRNNPRSMPSKGHKRRPFRLEESKRRLRELYFNPFKYEAGRLCYHEDKKNKDMSLRKKRSEIKEPITCAVGETIFHYLDLKTLKVGFTDSMGVFRQAGVDFIAKMSGHSYAQTRKVLKEYHNHGYITIHKNKYQNESGQYRSLPATIEVHELFFYHLGFSEDEIHEAQHKLRRKDHIAYMQQQRKEKEYIEKSTKKEAKKHLKSITKLIQAARSGQTLSAEDKETLDFEQPGWQNGTQKTLSIPDYTGISTNREEVIARNKPTQVAQSHLSEILKFLKQKNPPS